MNNDEILELCLSLLQADQEEDVISILNDAGFGDDPDVWRAYGDRSGNFSTIGNQQSRPEAALVEKITVDAVSDLQTRQAVQDTRLRASLV